MLVVGLRVSEEVSQLALMCRVVLMFGTLLPVGVVGDLKCLLASAQLVG